ncbi:hypothetical protein SAMN05216241_1198 [Limimonas halophila]|uniref:Uncharacterized protein n=1 Tax=Limimonas halophila TaxID=1082479 RepID=A0A1G7V0A3_9PROT|nr:hypothetical protein [Limimonas halophila]SDG53154.1 hypothetical protein SAMN05216241_1198 [Limimonas halophila]
MQHASNAEPPDGDDPQADTPAAIATARSDVATALPGLIRHALATYTAAATVEPAEQPKEQTAQQQAAKTALTHLETLLRLARNLAPPATEPSDAPGEADTDAAAEPADPAGMLRAARAAVHRLRA